MTLTRLPVALAAVLAAPCLCLAQASVSISDPPARDPAPPLAISTRIEDPSSLIDAVELHDTPARQAFDWFARVCGVPLVIDWVSLKAQGYDPDKPITLQLRMVSARQVLNLLMQQAQPPALADDAQLVYDATPDFLQVLTKAQANQRLVLRVYDLAEVTVSVPSFHNAPRMDLSAVLESSAAGGAGGGGLSLEQPEQPQRPPTPQESGERLAEMIRTMIEPSLWRQNGGPASIRYFAGRLVVNAPMYVQRRIGTAVPAASDPAGRSRPAARYVGVAATSAYALPPGAAPNAPAGASGRATYPRPVSPGIAAVDPIPARPIANRAP